MPDGVAFTWYGHATWGLRGLDNGARVLIDPWLSGPTFPAALRDGLAADVLVLTHGHVDHTGEIVEVAKRLGVPVLAPDESPARSPSTASRTPSGSTRAGRSRRAASPSP